MATSIAGTGAAGEVMVSPGQSAGGTVGGSVATDLLIDLGPGEQHYSVAGTHLVHRPRPTPKKAQSCQYLNHFCIYCLHKNHQ